MANPAFHGRFLWQELRSRDPTAAAEFYTRVMPWKSQPFALGTGYTVFVTGSDANHMVAGSTTLGDEASATGARPQWVGSIGSGDVDATVAQAVALGARVVQPAADMPNVGRSALLADPQGALFGVYKPAQEPRAGDAPSGGYSWHEYAAPDMEAGFSFYSALFGWKVVNRMDMGPTGVYLIFGRDGKQEGGMYGIPAGKAQHTGWLPYVSLRSADEAARATTAAGGKIANGPMDVPGGRIAQLIDPQGVMFAVHSITVAASAPKPAPKPAAKPTAVKPAATPAAAKPAAKPAAKAAPRKVARKKPKAARKAKRKVAAKSARRPAAKKSARKAARKPVRKAARKAARKSVRKAKRKPARKK